MPGKDDIIVSLLQEVREDQKDQSNVLHDHSLLLGDMKKDIAQNTKDLAEHKEGVVQNRVALVGHGKRILKLEEPKIFWKTLKGGIVTIGTLTGVTLGILRLLGKI